LLTLLALTWLNPHVYLDTVVLLGSISAQYQNRLAFGCGAVLARFVFAFAYGYGYGYGARVLGPFFAKPRSWQILDGISALTMCKIAVKLLLM
jgi:L-lysine exporter family protein LysE/ArgO